MNYICFDWMFPNYLFLIQNHKHNNDDDLDKETITDHEGNHHSQNYRQSIFLLLSLSSFLLFLIIWVKLFNWFCLIQVLREYQSCQYRVYQSRIDFQDGFIFINWRRLWYGFQCDFRRRVTQDWKSSQTTQCCIIQCTLDACHLTVWSCHYHSWHFYWPCLNFVKVNVFLCFT